MCRCAGANFLDGVPGRLKQDDVDLVEEDAREQAEAGRQDGDDLHGRDKLPVGAEIGGDEGDPDDEENEHAESDELGLREVLRQLPRLEGEEKADGRQEAGVADQKAQSHHRAFVAGNKDNLVDVVVSVAGRRSVVQPHHTYHHLHKGEQEDQKELQVQTPPLTMEAGGNLGFEHQKNSIGLHQDAGDAQDEADAKRRLAQTTCPVLRLANEHKRTGETADQREQQQVGQLPVRSLDYGRVPKSDKHANHEGCQENAEHGEKGQGDSERL